MPDMRNFVNLIGFLGRDAELHDYVGTNPATGESETRQCVELSLCTNSLRQPVYHDVVGYADHHIAHLGQMKTGDKLMVTGYLFYQQSEKKGVKRVHPKVVIDTFEKMNKKKPKTKEPASPKSLETTS